MSMRARTVSHNLSIFVGQQFWGEFFDLFRENIQCSREVSFAVTLRRVGLDDLQRVFPV